MLIAALGENCAEMHKDPDRERTGSQEVNINTATESALCDNNTAETGGGTTQVSGVFSGAKPFNREGSDID